MTTDAEHDKEFPPRYFFDLDGTLAYSQEGAHDHYFIGEPIPAMIAVIKKYIAEGKTCCIFTARYARRFTHPGIIELIQNWSLKHIGVVLEITNEKTPGVREIYDDIGISVFKNSGYYAKCVGWNKIEANPFITEKDIIK
jgi:hypothetical protein